MPAHFMFSICSMQQKGGSVGPFYVGDIPPHFALVEVRCDRCFHTAYLGGDRVRQVFWPNVRICDAKFICTKCKGRRVTRTIYVELRSIPIEQAYKPRGGR